MPGGSRSQRLRRLRAETVLNLKSEFKRQRSQMLSSMWSRAYEEAFEVELQHDSRW